MPVSKGSGRFQDSIQQMIANMLKLNILNMFWANSLGPPIAHSCYDQSALGPQTPYHRLVCLIVLSSALDTGSGYWVVVARHLLAYRVLLHPRGRPCDDFVSRYTALTVR